MSMFFPATAMGGRFYLADTSGYGPWNEFYIVYSDEREIYTFLKLSLTKGRAEILTPLLLAEEDERS